MRLSCLALAGQASAVRDMQYRHTILILAMSHRARCPRTAGSLRVLWKLSGAAIWQTANSDSAVPYFVGGLVPACILQDSCSLHMAASESDTCTRA